VSAAHLNGVLIDELRVQLNGDIGNNGRWVAADNLTLAPQVTAVPEPASLVAFALGVAGVVGRRRWQKRKEEGS
jgi:hypothetical protein